MDLYLTIIIISIGGFFIGNKKTRTFVYSALVIFMWYICAFRGIDVGVDTSTYWMLYENELAAERYESEFLYTFIVKKVYGMFQSPESCQVVLTSIMYLPFLYLINKKSKNIGFTILLFIFSNNRYFFETFNIVRQMCATPFLLLCWVWLSEKKYILAAAAAIISLGFHTSSLVFFPLAWIAYKYEFTYKNVIIAEITTLFVAFFFSNMRMFDDFFNMLSGLDFMRVSAYGKFSTYELQLTRTFFGLCQLLLPHAIVVFMFFEKHRDNFLMKLYFVGSIFLNIVGVTPLSYRMAYGIIAIELILYPILIVRTIDADYYKNERSRINIFIAMMLLLFVYNFYNFLTTAKMVQLVPYKFF